jgi:hypothetical protein
MNQNKVANTLKTTGIVGTILIAVSGLVLLCTVHELGFILFLVCAVSAFLTGLAFYAFGELIQLTQDIKDNTSKNIPTAQPREDEIPDI